MDAIKQSYHIKASVAQVWQALVDPKIIARWGGGPAKMDKEVGTKFSLWGGDIHGTNKEVVKEKKLVQEWYGGDWPKPSIITFILHGDDSETTVDLLQQDVPDAEHKNISEGWKEYYMGPLKKLLEK